MVERGPEKAGVGGSIPSLATTAQPELIRRANVFARSAGFLTAAMKSPAVGGSIPSLATTITKSEFIGRASVFARSAGFLIAAMESPAVGGSIPSLATIQNLMKPGNVCKFRISAALSRNDAGGCVCTSNEGWILFRAIEKDADESP